MGGRMMRGAAVAVLCSMLASSVQGCTAIGFATGAVADARAGQGGPELLTTAQAGRPVTLFLRDGRRIDGRFDGWSRDSARLAPGVEGVPPADASVRLVTSGGEVTIRVREIERVSIGVNHWKVRGLLLGLAVDVAMLALTAYAMGQAVEHAFSD